MRIILPLTLLLYSGLLIAQNPCGTPPGRSAWLKKYQVNPDIYEKGGDTLLYVPITVHLLGSDEGAGHLKLNRLLAAFCRLNQDFEQAGIQFFQEGAVHYINNSAWNEHPDIPTGVEMMFANNVENTLNVYFLDDPAGNAGYNLNYAGIALREDYAGPDSHTWAHEVGHALSVQHPFLGWEGGVSHDGSVPHDYNDPAPVYVTYDYTLFKNIYYPDTLIIDTALVELVDGSNCQVAADGFCDTSPDYLYSRWNCDINNLSGTVQTDPTGATFRSDGTLIMNYGNDVCQNRFTAEQIAAMRAFLIDQRPQWLYDPTPPQNLTQSVATPVYPVNDELVNYQGIQLNWNAVPGAVSYLVQLATGSGFPESGLKEFVTTDTTLNLDDLLINRRYYWRVKPFNRYHFCEPVSGTAVFRSAQVVSAPQLAGIEKWILYPNPAGESRNLRLNATLQKNMPLRYRVQDAAGRVVFQRHTTLYAGEQDFPLGLPELPRGVYWIHWTNGAEWKAEKVVI